MDNGNGSKLRQHNVLATFPDKQSADDAVQGLRSRSIPPDRVVVTTKGDEPAVATAEMRDELEGMVAGAGLGTAMTKTQAEGALAGMLLFGAIGAVIGVVIGLIVAGGLPGPSGPSARSFWAAVVSCTVGGGTLGVIAGGFIKQRFRPAPGDKAEFEDEHVAKATTPGPRPATEQEPVVEVRTDDPAEFERALGYLESLRPLRIDTVDAEGRVLSTKEVGPGRSDVGGPAPGRTDF